MSNKSVHFNDGEGLDFNDLNALRRLIQKEAGDHLYGRMIQLRNQAPDWSAYWGQGAATSIITFGAALQMNVGGASRTISFEGGSLLLSNAGSAAEPPYDDASYSTRLCYPISFWGQSIALAANASGSDRWDAIVIANADFNEGTTGDNENRDFMDAVTRAITTTSLPKRTYSPAGNNALATPATLLTVVQGTPGAGKPSISGNQAVAYVKVPNGATQLGGSYALLRTDYEDWTTPAGRVWIGMLGRDANRTAAGALTNWGSSGTVAIATNTGSSVAYWFPREMTGRSDAKFLGVHIVHEADEAFTAQIVRVNYDGTADTVLSTITVGTTDGQHREIMSYGDATVPLWGNGTPAGRTLDLGTSAGTNPLGSASHIHSTLALKITSGAGGGTSTVICAVAFVFAANDF